MNIEESKEQNISFSVYPSPANEMINMELSANETFNWRIVDMQGVVVMEGKVELTADKYPLNIAHLTEGVYAISIQINDSNLIKRFVKIQ